MKSCEIPACVNELRDDDKHKHCKTCRNSRYYWNDKRPAQILERRRKLNMYGGRLDKFFLNDNGHKGRKH